MFSKITNKKVRKQLTEGYEFVKAQTAIGPAFCALIPEDAAKQMIEAEPTSIEVVPGAVKDANGMIAVRAKGVAPAPGASQAPANTSTQGTKPVFTIESGVPLPAIQRGGLKGPTYPFEQLEIGQSFFIASTAEKPNPAKSMASTVSSATKRYADKPVKKQFTVRAVKENGNITGARVWRIEDAKPTAATGATA